MLKYIDAERLQLQLFISIVFIEICAPITQGSSFRAPEKFYVMKGMQSIAKNKIFIFVQHTATHTFRWPVVEI